MSYWRCHYHLIWTTRQRLSVIDSLREGIIGRCVSSISDAEKIELHAVGVVEDHVHIAVSIPPRLSVSSVVKLYKGSSSHQLQKSGAVNLEPWPGWQSEYGVLTFGDGSFDRIVAYVVRQKEHHRDETLWPAMEQVRADQSHGNPASP